MSEDEDVTSPPPKKLGRPVMLGEDLDKKLQLYVKKAREGGGVITARILSTAARGVLVACERLRLVEFWGHVQLNQSWTYSLFERMKFVKCKVTTAKSKHTDADFARIKKTFLQEVVKTRENGGDSIRTDSKIGIRQL